MKQYKLKVNGNPYDVTIASIDGNGMVKVVVNGRQIDVEIDNDNGKKEENLSAPVDYPLKKTEVPRQVSAGATTVVSPLPGVVIGMHVAVGDKVSAGQTVATIEAMKMENDIESESAGTVTAVFVQKGESVLEGAKIVTIA